MNRDLCSTGMVVIMDSVFYVLRRILEIMKRGYFGILLIKICSIYTRGVHGDIINVRFSTENINGVGFLIGEWYYTEFNIFIVK